MIRPVSHGGYVGIEAHSRILNIKHERIDPVEHVVARTDQRAVETVERQRGRRLHARRDTMIDVAVKSVLRSLMPCRRIQPEHHAAKATPSTQTVFSGVSCFKLERGVK